LQEIKQMDGKTLAAPSSASGRPSNFNALPTELVYEIFDRLDAGTLENIQDVPGLSKRVKAIVTEQLRDQETLDQLRSYIPRVKTLHSFKLELDRLQGLSFRRLQSEPLAELGGRIAYLRHNHRREAGEAWSRVAQPIPVRHRSPLLDAVADAIDSVPKDREPGDSVKFKEAQGDVLYLGKTAEAAISEHGVTAPWDKVRLHLEAWKNLASI
jgi:hypothetical protein